MQPIRASRPRTVDASRPSRAPRPTEPHAHPSCAKRIFEPSLTNCRAVRPSKPWSRIAGPCIRAELHEPPGRAYARALGNALGLAYARHAHSAVHTPEHTHSLAQVTLDLLCSTLSYMSNMFCFCLYTSRLSAGLIMWDNSQFLFFSSLLFKLHTYLT